jgi:hypothetical protein
MQVEGPRNVSCTDYEAPCWRTLITHVRRKIKYLYAALLQKNWFCFNLMSDIFSYVFKNTICPESCAQFFHPIYLNMKKYRSEIHAPYMQPKQYTDITRVSNVSYLFSLFHFFNTIYWRNALIHSHLQPRNGSFWNKFQEQSTKQNCRKRI